MPMRLTDRWARSVATSAAENVPVLDSLPLIETEATSLRRPQMPWSNRAIALAIVAVKGETGDHELGQRLIVQSLMRTDLFSSARTGLHGCANRRPNSNMWISPGATKACMFCCGQSESSTIWAVRIRLPMCDLIADMLRELGADGLRAKAKLRPQSELLDAADLIYRYDWAVVNARINGEPAPAGLDGGVVYEWHYALNWLIGYAGQDWDDITTDT